MDSKLERDKVLILYILQHTGKELSNSELSELMLEMDDMDYFRLQEALSDLVAGGLISTRSMPGTTFYRIEPEGASTLLELKDELHRERLKKLKLLLGEMPDAEEDSLRPLAEYYKTKSGGFAVRCRIVKSGISQMEFTIPAPSEEAAKTICLNWPQKCDALYQKIMEELM
ncbi:MAG: DUF4364 family protein [Blautia sp.]|nr:DUF4364 family protein [Blautia sp.]